MKDKPECPVGLKFGIDWGERDCFLARYFGNGCDEEAEADCWFYYIKLCSEFPEQNIWRLHPDRSKYKCPAGIKFGSRWLDKDSGCIEDKCDMETQCMVYYNTYDIDEEEKHIGCPSYPNCDLDPNGCAIEMGDEVEWYGHRD